MCSIAGINIKLLSACASRPQDFIRRQQQDQWFESKGLYFLMNRLSENARTYLVQEHGKFR